MKQVETPRSYEYIISAEGLRKTFATSDASSRVGVGPQEGLELNVLPGEIFGIIGPDGAGKTTLFRLLTSLYAPEEGRVTLAGYDSVKEYKFIRQHIGYMPGQFSLYMDLTIEENLQFFATIYDADIEENYELIADIYEQILPFKKRRAGALSGGMKQKLALCCALIHKPLVLFLDEPTTGIDPVSRVELWDMLQKLARHGVTVVVSTAYMDEARRCDRVALMQGGQIVQLDTPEAIAASYPYDLYKVSADEMIPMLRHIRRSFKEMYSCFAFGDALHVAMTKGTMTVEEIKHRLLEEGFSDVTVMPIEPGLEDSFMSLSDSHEESITIS